MKLEYLLQRQACKHETDQERLKADISRTRSGNMTVICSDDSDIWLALFMLPVGSCSVICVFSISAKFGCKPDAACKPHTAHLFISKLISGPGAYFSASYGEPQCQSEDMEFHFEKPPAPFSPVSQ